MTRPPCETCDFIGPELPCLATDGRALHRALADLGYAIAATLLLVRMKRALGWLDARLARWRR